MQLESLQLVVNAATDAVNAWGSLIDARLQDILAYVQEIALNGVRHGVSVALTVALVKTRHDLHAMEVGFLIGDSLEGHEDLIEEFTVAAKAIVDITSA